MSTLESLIRIHRWRLDERRRHVVELETLAEQLRQDLRRLAEERRTEEAIAASSFEAQHGYAGYIRRAMERQQALESSLADTEQEILRAREALAEAFQEMKRYEIAVAARERHRQQQLARRERVELDSIAVENFRRRTDPGIRDKAS